MIVDAILDEYVLQYEYPHEYECQDGQPEDLLLKLGSSLLNYEQSLVWI